MKKSKTKRTKKKLVFKDLDINDSLIDSFLANESDRVEKEDQDEAGSQETDPKLNVEEERELQGESVSEVQPTSQADEIAAPEEAEEEDVASLSAFLEELSLANKPAGTEKEALEEASAPPVETEPEVTAEEEKEPQEEPQNEVQSSLANQEIAAPKEAEEEDVASLSAFLEELSLANKPAGIEKEAPEEASPPSMETEPEVTTEEEKESQKEPQSEAESTVGDQEIAVPEEAEEEDVASLSTFLAKFSLRKKSVEIEKAGQEEASTPSMETAPEGTAAEEREPQKEPQSEAESTVGGQEIAAAEEAEEEDVASLSTFLAKFSLGKKSVGFEKEAPDQANAPSMETEPEGTAEEEKEPREAPQSEAESTSGEDEIVVPEKAEEEDIASLSAFLAKFSPGRKPFGIEKEDLDEAGMHSLEIEPESSAEKEKGTQKEPESEAEAISQDDETAFPEEAQEEDVASLSAFLAKFSFGEKSIGIEKEELDQASTHSLETEPEGALDEDNEPQREPGGAAQTTSRDDEVAFPQDAQEEDLAVLSAFLAKISFGKKPPGIEEEGLDEAGTHSLQIESEVSVEGAEELQREPGSEASPASRDEEITLPQDAKKDGTPMPPASAKEPLGGLEDLSEELEAAAEKGPDDEDDRTTDTGGSLVDLEHQRNKALDAGIRYYQSRSYEQAIGEFKKVVQMEPDFKDVYSWLGTAYLRNDMIPEAIETYEQLKKLDPNNLHVYENLGIIYARSGEISLAVEEWQALLLRAPHRADIRHKLRNVLKEHKRDASLVQKAGRKDKVTLMIEGIERFKLKDYESAIHFFEQIVEQQPESKEAHKYLGNAYFRNNMFSEARSTLEKAVQLNKKDLNAYESLGFTYARLGNYDLATKAFRKILEIEPYRIDITQKANAMLELQNRPRTSQRHGLQP